MKEVLRDLLNNSRSDYFHFPVSACVVCNDGSKFYGVNVETSSPSAGVCAERNALYNAITNGKRKEDIKEVHVMSNNNVTPCFICRQALVDYCNLDINVYSYDVNGNEKVYILKDLCPSTFSSEDL